MPTGPETATPEVLGWLLENTHPGETWVEPEALVWHHRAR